MIASFALARKKTECEARGKGTAILTNNLWLIKKFWGADEISGGGPGQAGVQDKRKIPARLITQNL